MTLKLSEVNHRTKLMTEIDLLLKGTGYECINSQYISLPKDHPLVIKYRKIHREFDILVVEESAHSDTRLEMEGIIAVIETKPFNSSNSNPIPQANDAFSAFKSAKFIYGTNFDENLYRRERDQQESSKICKGKTIHDRIKKMALIITSDIKRSIAEKTLALEQPSEKAIIETIQDCMDVIQGQMKELPDESMTELFARSLIIYTDINDEDIKTKNIKSKNVKKELQQEASNMTRKEKLSQIVKRTASYIIVGQILFYDLLKRNNKKYKLREMRQLAEDASPKFLYIEYLNDAIDKTTDFKPIFEIDLLSLLPETKSVIQAINRCIKGIQDLHLVPNTDFLGKIYHHMMPLKMRHPLSAFYTGSVPARLLALLAIDHQEMKICDFACGSGTLLVESYHVLKDMYRKNNPQMTGDEIHDQILKYQIYGNDITLYASFLSAMNLASQFLDGEVSKINISSIDGLKIEPDGKPIYTVRGIVKKFLENEGEPVSRLDKEKENDCVIFPHIDCVIMNPPFSRQTNMSDKQLKGLKARSIEWFPASNEKQLDKWLQIDGQQKPGQRKNFISAKMGLQGYFIIHADHFLECNGVLAMILSTNTFTCKYTKQILAYLKSREYGIKYVIEILNKRAAFSEISNFNEYMVVCQKGMLTNNATTRMVTLKREIEQDDITEIFQKLQDKNDIELGDHELLVIRTIPTRILYSSLKWTNLFPGANKTLTIERIFSSPILENYEDNTSNIEIFRGFVSTHSKYLILPNHDWSIDQLNATTFRLDHHVYPEDDEQRYCQIPANYLIHTIRSSEDANDLIAHPNHWALNIPPEPKGDLMELLRKYIPWAEPSIEEDIRKARKRGQKRNDIVKLGTMKDGKLVKPWFSIIHKRCEEVRNDLFIIKKYRPTLRRSIVIYSPEVASVNDGFQVLKTPDSKFYASYGQSIIFLVSLFQEQRTNGKSYWQLTIDNCCPILKFPRYSDFDDATKMDLIAKWQSFANASNIPFLPQQFGVDEISPMDERVALDNAWLGAIGIEADEIDAIRDDLYKWLIYNLKSR